jgi:hypothetical protein
MSYLIHINYDVQQDRNETMLIEDTKHLVHYESGKYYSQCEKSHYFS